MFGVLLCLMQACTHVSQLLIYGLLMHEALNLVSVARTWLGETAETL